MMLSGVDLQTDTNHKHAHNFIDLIGMRFGRLTVLKEMHKSQKDCHTYWLCRCDCGVEKLIDGNHLRRGRIVSCGCFKKENSSKVGKTRALDGKICSHTTHGSCHTRLYCIWTNMKTRCYNANNRAYKWYGAKGVRVCKEWLNDFAAFKTWAESNGYSDDLTIDRVNPNADYSPENCRWITIQEQRKTTRRYVEKNGTYK